MKIQGCIELFYAYVVVNYCLKIAYGYLDCLIARSVLCHTVWPYIDWLIFGFHPTFIFNCKLIAKIVLID